MNRIATKRLILAVVAMIATLAASAQRTFIYRNDSTFTRIHGAATLRHTVTTADSSATTMLTVGPVELPTADVDSITLRTRDIPTLYIATPGEPDLAELTEKERYIDCTVRLEGNGTADDFAETSGKLRGRGNSTWGFAKKPYRIKLNKKASIAGFKKAKNYVLLANYVDATKLKNALAYWLARRVGCPAANHTRACDVVLNGIWKGAYLMTEKVGISSESVDIDEREGVLMELSTEFDEKYRFRSAMFDHPVMIKDPDFDELAEEDGAMGADERLALWEADYARAEQMVVDGRGLEAFDVESLVSFMIVNQVMCNCELGHPKSLYLHKRSLGEEEKYGFGPVWDFDAAANTYRLDSDGALSLATDPATPLWLCELLGRLVDEPEFQTLYCERMTRVLDELYPEMLEWLAAEAALIEPSAKTDGAQWGAYDAGWIYAESSLDHHERVADLRQWLEARRDYLRAHIASIPLNGWDADVEMR